MNLLEISFGQTSGEISLRGDHPWQEILSYDSYADGFEKAVQLIKTEALSYDGGTLLFTEESFLLSHGCYPLPQGGYNGIISYFTEALNAPFLLGIPTTSPDFKKQLYQAREEAEWTLQYYDFHPGKEEYCVESLLTTGNGYMGLRGTLPEMEICDDTYPATYIAGLYDRAESTVDGQVISNEDFVNAPNLQSFSVSIGNASPITLTPEHILFLSRRLNMKNGLFESQMIYEDEQNRQMEIQTKRFVSLENRNQYHIQYTVEPLNFSETLTVYAKAEGDVYNYNVERYRSLTRSHLEIDEVECDDKNTLLVAHTKQSKTKIVQKSLLHIDEAVAKSPIVFEKTNTSAMQKIAFSAVSGQSYCFEKTVHVSTFSPEETVKCKIATKAPILPLSFEKTQKASAPLWETLWDEADVVVEGDLFSQKMLHLHAYHLLVSASFPGNRGLDVSVTARGLHGEGYRGHIFWDELFIFPFYIYHYPKTARTLLFYRFNRLAAAKKNAKENGYAGAMYPWQSGASGEEETQEKHLNPLTGVWGDDHSRLQRHVSLAIAYNIWTYVTYTGDTSILKEGGAETYLEIVRFWASIASYSKEDERYHISGVMGPDEFHEAFPGNPSPGLKDNAYTNIMVVWLIEEMDKILSSFSPKEQNALLEKSDITLDVQEKLATMKAKLALDISPDGIIAQFDGYFTLKEVDWDYYRKKYGNIYRMDRILLAEGESADEYQVSKQADLFMAFYNLPEKRVLEILNHLGYTLPDGFELENYRYYLARTSHGSTLSRVVYSAVGWELGQDSQAMYQQALSSDYDDIQGGTTAEGIHTGVMAATLDATVSIYGGLNLQGELPEMHPKLPEAWKKLSFSFHFQSVRYKVTLTEESATLTASQDATLIIENQKVSLKKEEPMTILLKGGNK